MSYQNRTIEHAAHAAAMLGVAAARADARCDSRKVLTRSEASDQAYRLWAHDPRFSKVAGRMAMEYADAYRKVFDTVERRVSCMLEWRRDGAIGEFTMWRGQVWATNGHERDAAVTAVQETLRDSAEPTNVETRGFAFTET